MNRSTSLLRTTLPLLLCLLITQYLFAHNGKVARAYPLGKIIVDGNFSDWPSNGVKFPINTVLSDIKPQNDADYSGFFQIGYRLDNQSLYIAFTVTDNEFLEDTSSNVRWDSQDGLELYLDARHLPFGSGVASFMYTKKLRNINKAAYDSFASKASWEIMEVAMVRKGNKRFYEWRIKLGGELTVGKSIGLDFNLFDRDSDGSFSFSSWGKGASKYMNAGSLGDIIISPVGEKLASLSGHVNWENPIKGQSPGAVRITGLENQKLWLEKEVDSLGNYSAEVPPGSYEITYPEQFSTSEKKIFISEQQAASAKTTVKAGQKVKAPAITISSSTMPDLIPAKGVLHDFTSSTAQQVDQFIETYQKFYGIPGVSLALVKDGKIVYHQTYGYKNYITKEKVDDNTLFEAASITKPVFAFAVQRLAERGIIDLDKPLYLYLPYEDIAYDDRYKLMTAKHVLTHRTGFPNWRYMNADGKLNLLFTPGTDYNYSGEGFEYLKMVVEKITGKKVEQVLKEEVIEPMGLYHTFFSANDSLQRVVSNGHFDRMPSSTDLPQSPGMAYSMHTEASIFTRFMLYMAEEKGLKPETYDSIFSRHSEFKFDPGEPLPKFPVYMGISLEIRETPFGKSFGHGGNNGDFKCQFVMYKDLKMGFAIFTNSNTSDDLLQAIRQFLVDGKDTP